MPDHNLKRLIHKNLMYSIRTIIGSDLFRHIYVQDQRDGREFDALDDGSGACAYTVSGVLALHGLIDHPHATVATTIKHMQEAGWVKTDDPQPGDVVQWAAHNDHMHMAFYIGNGRVIGNSTRERKTTEYGLTLEDGREPIAFYTHPQLHENSSHTE
jgi:hypothetical protein